MVKRSFKKINKRNKFFDQAAWNRARKPWHYTADRAAVGLSSYKGPLLRESKKKKHYTGLSKFLVRKKFVRWQFSANGKWHKLKSITKNAARWMKRNNKITLKNEKRHHYGFFCISAVNRVRREKMYARRLMLVQSWLKRRLAPRARVTLLCSWRLAKLFNAVVTKKWAFTYETLWKLFSASRPGSKKKALQDFPLYVNTVGKRRFVGRNLRRAEREWLVVAGLRLRAECLYRSALSSHCDQIINDAVGLEPARGVNLRGETSIRGGRDNKGALNGGSKRSRIRRALGRRGVVKKSVLLRCKLRSWARAYSSLRGAKKKRIFARMAAQWTRALRGGFGDLEAAARSPRAYGRGKNRRWWHSRPLGGRRAVYRKRSWFGIGPVLASAENDYVKFNLKKNRQVIHALTRPGQFNMMMRPSYSRRMASKITSTMKHRYIENVIETTRRESAKNKGSASPFTESVEPERDLRKEEEDAINSRNAMTARQRALDLPHQAVWHNEVDGQFLEEFIKKKKEINKIIARTPKGFTVDYVPNKYFFFNLRIDPLSGSFLMNKIINAFLKCGKKKTIRNIFYKLLRTNKEYLTVAAFYYMIEALKPKFINVVARRGRDVYRAPISASNVKATMKAIRFFKRSVMSRKHEDSLFDKIDDEMYDFFYTYGYENEFYADYVAQSESNRHLRHFRRKAVY